MTKTANQTIAVNRKAKFEYFLYDRYDAGISLLGSEVKALREGRVNLGDSFVRIVRGEAFLVNCHITPYSKIQGHVPVDPLRSRKLLLKKAEINRLMGQAAQKGFAIIALQMYFSKRNFAKVEIAVAKGKKQFDKRESIKRRIHDRESAQAIKRHSRK